MKMGKGHLRKWGSKKGRLLDVEEKEGLTDEWGWVKLKAELIVGMTVLSKVSVIVRFCCSNIFSQYPKTDLLS